MLPCSNLLHSYAPVTPQHKATERSESKLQKQAEGVLLPLAYWALSSAGCSEVKLQTRLNYSPLTGLLRLGAEY